MSSLAKECQQRGCYMFPAGQERAKCMAKCRILHPRQTVATLFVAGVVHESGNLYTESDLESMAKTNPYSMFTEHDKDGRLQLKVRD